MNFPEGLKMLHPESHFSSVCAALFGCMQLVHGALLIAAAVRWLKEGSFGFPALPPPGGWSPQAKSFLLGTGIADALTIGVSIFFVRAFFKKRPSRWFLGITVLTAQTYSTVVYLFGIYGSGSASVNPAGIAALAVLFIPFYLLLFLFIHWWRKGFLFTGGSLFPYSR